MKSKGKAGGLRYLERRRNFHSGQANAGLSGKKDFSAEARKFDEPWQPDPWEDLCRLAPKLHRTKAHLFPTLNHLKHRQGPPKPLEGRRRRRFDGWKNGLHYGLGCDERKLRTPGENQ